MSHTQEPWAFTEGDHVVSESDQDNNGFFIADCFGPDHLHNARRIVACVNGCRGISTDLLENVTLQPKQVAARESLSTYVKQIEAQRDELLKLVKECRATFEMWKDVAPAVSLCNDLDAAIANAEGTKL